MNAWNTKFCSSAKALNYPFKKLKNSNTYNPFFNPHTIYFFHRPINFNPRSQKVYAMPTLIHHKDFNKGVRPYFSMAENGVFESFQLHAFRLNNTDQKFAIPYKMNWSFYELDYQMTLDEVLQFFMSKEEEKEAEKQKQNTQKKIIKEDSYTDKPPAPGMYWQDSQEPEGPNLDLHLDEIGKLCNIDATMEPVDDLEEPEPKYVCLDDGYGCCEKHMVEFEIDH